MKLSLCMVMDQLTRELRVSLIPAEINSLETEEEIDRLSDSMGYYLWGTAGFWLLSDHPHGFTEAVRQEIEYFKVRCIRELAGI